MHEEMTHGVCFNPLQLCYVTPRQPEQCNAISCTCSMYTVYMYIVYTLNPEYFQDGIIPCNYMHSCANCAIKVRIHFITGSLVSMC